MTCAAPGGVRRLFAFLAAPSPAMSAHPGRGRGDVRAHRSFSDCLLAVLGRVVRAAAPLEAPQRNRLAINGPLSLRLPGADLPPDPPGGVAHLCDLVMPVLSREQNASSATGKERMCRKGMSRRVYGAARSVDQVADLLAQATQDTRAGLANVVGG